MTTLLRRRALRGRRGSLKEFPDMPLDILFEVFSHIEPMDLLNLARTSKPFRELLLHRSAASLWKQARQNVPGLPECPPFMSEPAFINLCFDSHCHKCLRPNIQPVMWAFRVRYCRHCKSGMIVMISQVRQILEAASPFRARYDIRELLISESEPWLRGRPLFKFHKADLETLVEAWKGSGAEVQEDIHSSQLALIKQMRDNADLCSKWQMDRKLSRSAEIDELKDARYSAIIAKLREFGWGEVIDDSPWSVWSRLRGVRGVRVPKQLTNRSWQAIETSVLQVMEALKSAKNAVGHITDLPSLPQPFNDMHTPGSVPTHMSVVLQRLQLLEDFMWSFRSRPEFESCFPGTREFALMPEVRSILDKPEYIEVSYNTFNILRPALPGLVERWKGRKLQVLQQLVIDEVATLPHGVDVLNLTALLYYRCWCCSVVIRYPDVLAHTCNAWKCQSGLDYSYDLYHRALDSKPMSWTRDTMHVETESLRLVLATNARKTCTNTVTDMEALNISYPFQFGTPAAIVGEENEELADAIARGSHSNSLSGAVTFL